MRNDRLLRSALRVILPTETETGLLRTILHSGEAGRSAWLEWHQRVGNPLTAFERIHPAQKGLVPLLHLAANRNELKIDSAFANFLRAAYFREELRGNAYRRILRETLETLGGNPSDTVVLRGCALSDTVYDVPQARHSHGIHLLLRDVSSEETGNRLRSIGFKPAQSRNWTHHTGLPLELHTQLLDLPYYAAPMSDVWLHVRPLPGWEDVAGRLTPEHALLHVCGHSAHSASRTSLQWVCDAWLLITHQPALDWKLFLDTAEKMKLGIPMSIMMRYLAEALDAPVPAGAVVALDSLAEKANSVAWRIAILGALGGARTKMRRAVATALGIRIAATFGRA